MKRYTPNYYTKFKCIASACKHSCCVGWEIDVDEDSYKWYQDLTHPYGETVRKRITVNEGVPCFALTETERCPFLQENGLCEMILTLGEDSLCQICRDHPRFYNLFSDREEIGIGLCCEEAARLVLSQNEKTEIILLSDDGNEEGLWEDEAELLALRGELFEILQNQEISLDDRINTMLCHVQASAVTYLSFWQDKLISLEQLDPAWQDLVKSLTLSQENSQDLDAPLEKFILYLLFRHLPNAQDEDEIRATVRFAALGSLIVKTICQNTGTPIEEVARLFSSEIEYSEENTRTLLNLLA